MRMRGIRRSLAWRFTLPGVALLALGLVAAGCGDDDDAVTVDAAVDGGGGADTGTDGATAAVLKGASKSSTIALSDDGLFVAMVLPESNRVAIYKTSDNTVSSLVNTGNEPSAVVIGPDSKTMYVANRATATVVKVTGIDTATPVVGTPTDVGSEPTGLALSPTGGRLFVAEWAESRVSWIATATMTVGGSITVRNPRSVSVTNDGDGDDTDELVIAPEFYGTPVAGKEARDDGRSGAVRLYNFDLSLNSSMTFAPRDSTFAANAATGTTMTSPNQLWAVAISGTPSRIFVPAVAASPQGPPNFSQNVFPMIYVGKLSDKTEDASAAGTINLARKVVDAIPAPTAAAPRWVMGGTVDISFVPNLPNISYAVSRDAEAVTRIVWDTAAVNIGSTINKQIDLLGNLTAGPCQNPNGIVVKDSTRAYVNCWGNRRLAVLNLTDQAVLITVDAGAPRATADTDEVRRGRHFYFTGRGRWSATSNDIANQQATPGNGAKGGQGWSSCGSCHPDGLSDNITWIFGTGPRQTTSQDGSFSHGAGAQKQRAFNWTGVFDEHHDFEANTRGTSGGLGAVTSSATCADFTTEVPVAIPAAGLGRPVKEVAADTTTTPTLCIRTDWDDIDAYVKTIRPPRAVRQGGGDPVAGRTVFTDQGCAKCHGGAGWTLSKRQANPPTGAGNTALAAAAFNPLLLPVGPWTTTWFYGATNVIGGQPIIAADTTGPAEAAAIGPTRIACVLRNVGTFGIPGDATATDALELKPGANGRSQGRGGYNIPSLYGLAVGAPYLHHGQAKTLNELFTDTKWNFHTQAGAANPASATELSNLIAFLLSIDASTPEFTIPTGGTGAGSHDQCP